MPFEKHYEKSVGKFSDRLHFAAHSHHPWPDVTQAAQLKAWDFAAEHLDQKWRIWFGNNFPKLEHKLSQLLNVKLDDQGQQTFAFGPNTHQLLCTILSAHPEFGERPLRVVASDSEFHSFSRQISRLSQWRLGDKKDPAVELITVPTLPLSEFGKNLENTLRREKNIDVLFLSQVFFNHGGYLRDLETIVGVFRKYFPDIQKSWTIVDGYHALGAVPVDLSRIQTDIFYLGGGYKYLQAGEGACFAFVPKPLSSLNPVLTGWFSEFGALSKPSRGISIAYGARGAALSGATQDLSAWFRLASVFDFWETEFGSITEAVKQARQHVLDLQDHWLQKWQVFLNERNLGVKVPLHTDQNQRGNFLAIPLEGFIVTAERLVKDLENLNLITDARGINWRVGFGIYQTRADIERFFERMATLEYFKCAK